MMSGEDNLLEEAGRTLRHEQSLGNRMLSSIDQDWLADHKDLLDLFVKDPNDPFFLEQVPQSAPQPMDIEQPPMYLPSDSPPRQPLAEMSDAGGSQMTQERGGRASPQACAEKFQNLRAGTPPMSGPADTSRRREQSPAEEEPSRRPRSASLQLPRSSPKPTLRSRSERSLGRVAGIVPEVSLAARAGSLGATSMQTSFRLPGRPGGRPQPQPQSEVGTRSSAEDSENQEAEEEEEEEEEQPARKGPGRKKRTAPILVETEDGETKYVTPAEFRKLRRRITNRLSARRMRKKHAEERNVVQDKTKTLEEERDHYKMNFEKAQQEIQRLQALSTNLHSENLELKSYCFRLPSVLPEAGNLAMGGLPMASLPLEPTTPAFPTPQMPSSSPLTFNMNIQANCMEIGRDDMLSGMPGMPAIPSFSAPINFLGSAALPPPQPLSRTSFHSSREDHVYPGRPLKREGYLE